MTGRIVWWATLAIIAVVTTALQLDMQSRRTPQLASAVPAPLRSHAQTRIVRSALAGEDATLAVREAERLVQRRPLPAESLILLATAQAKAGQMEAAARTIQIAGQRGWREPVAQEAVLRLALAAGDKPEAARRYAALFLNGQTPDALLEELGRLVLDEPGGPGQQTVTAIVVGGERWHAAFLRRGAQVMPPKAFSAITVASQEKGARFDCAMLDQAVLAVTRRDADAGAQLQQAAADCPPARS